MAECGKLMADKIQKGIPAGIDKTKQCDHERDLLKDLEELGYDDLPIYSPS